jgi:hypothetical protein
MRPWTPNKRRSHVRLCLDAIVLDPMLATSNSAVAAV